MSEAFDKLWDHSTLNPETLIVQVGRVNDMNRSQKAKLYETVNRHGVAIVQHAPRPDEMVEEVIDLGRLFGKPVPHDRADARGLVVVAEISGYGEFVGASSGPHLMHTGGPFMPWKDVPRIVLLQCEKQSRVGGRSMLASGAAAFRYLQHNDPESLKLLMDPKVFSIQRSAHGGQFGGTGVSGKAVFDTQQLGNGNIWLTFRFDGQIKLELQPDAAHEAYDKLLNFFNQSENQIDFKLQPNQIMVCDNTSVVHARTAFQAGSGRKLNRLQLDGVGIQDLHWGFPRPN